MSFFCAEPDTLPPYNLREKTELGKESHCVFGKSLKVKIPFPRTKKGKIAACAGCLAVAVGGVFILSPLFSAEEAAAEYTEYTVDRGDIEVTISGSGTVEAAASYDVVALVQGEVLTDTFEEGDLVEKDQLL